MVLGYGLALPFLGTALGAGCVFFMKRALPDGLQRALTGFAAGVMVAATFWSLLAPALEQAAGLGRWAFFPALTGLLRFAAGAMLYVVVEELLPEMSQGRHSHTGVLAFALGFWVMMVLDVALG